MDTSFDFTVELRLLRESLDAINTTLQEISSKLDDLVVVEDYIIEDDDEMDDMDDMDDFDDDDDDDDDEEEEFGDHDYDEVDRPMNFDT